MSEKKHHVILTGEQKERLDEIAFKPNQNTKAKQIIVARALLKSAAGWTDPAIAEALDVSISTIRLWRKKFCQEGLETCLKRKEQQNRSRKITGDVEASIVKICCEKPPKGQARWTVDLVKERVLELKILNNISRSAIGKTLKKTKLNLGSSNDFASHPNKTASL